MTVSSPELSKLIVLFRKLVWMFHFGFWKNKFKYVCMRSIIFVICPLLNLAMYFTTGMSTLGILYTKEKLQTNDHIEPKPS